ncbi:hypothetical protein BC643_4323 [Mangrovibacterium diazotrophicum]|uniref:Uncharacterized protein n=1 Tax=Mangrovibacterium diazotrophicum TaxID=1261403 RepID=A0A419VV24_9BACT|nr:hypothetical protein BC643_4323 [Mangrovibacterium diazotrophicum]
MNRIRERTMQKINAIRFIIALKKKLPGKTGSYQKGKLIIIANLPLQTSPKGEA